jgi:hypothetical protein
MQSTFHITLVSETFLVSSPLTASAIGHDWREKALRWPGISRGIAIKKGGGEGHSFDISRNLRLKAERPSVGVLVHGMPNPDTPERILIHILRNTPSSLLYL